MCIDKEKEDLVLMLQAIYGINAKKCPICGMPCHIDDIIKASETMMIYGQNPRNILSALNYAKERGWTPIEDCVK